MTPTPVGMRCPACARDRTKAKTVRSLPSIPMLTQILVAINVAVFLAEVATGTPLGGVGSGGLGTVFTKAALAGPLVVGPDAHDYYRLLTSGFIHDGLLHILFNMWFLYIMGAILEPAIGRLSFGAVYLASLLAGSFGAMLFTPGAYTAGASGACFGILGALMVVAHSRGMTVWRSGLGLTVVINVVFDLTVPGISIGGHLAGFIAGGICGWLLVEVGERRRMQGAAVAGCVLVAAVSVALALAVAGSTGIAPNGVTL